MANQNQKNILAEKLKYYLERKGITQTDLARELNYPEMTVSNWVNAKFYPRIDKIQEMADYFGVQKSDLIEDKLNLSNISNIIPLDKARRIPILGRIACGEPIWAEENFEGYFIADASIKASFILRAKGDSMIDANIHDGDLVFIKKDFEIINGNIYAVLIEEEATLKRVNKLGGKFILNPANSNYQPIILDGSKESMILGEMVGVYNVRSK